MLGGLIALLTTSECETEVVQWVYKMKHDDLSSYDLAPIFLFTADQV